MRAAAHCRDIRNGLGVYEQICKAKDPVWVQPSPSNIAVASALAAATAAVAVAQADVDYCTNGHLSDFEQAMGQYSRTKRPRCLTDGIIVANILHVPSCAEL